VFVRIVGNKSFGDRSHFSDNVRIYWRGNHLTCGKRTGKLLYNIFIASIHWELNIFRMKITLNVFE